MDFTTLIKNNKPNLSSSSINTYNIILNNLFKKIYPSKNIQQHYKLLHSQKTIDYVKTLTTTQRKSMWSALLSINPNNEIVRDLLTEDFKKHNEELQQQPDKPQNLIDPSNLQTIQQNLQQLFNELIKNKTHTIKELQTIQDFVILSLYTLIEPRRLQDFTKMKIKNFKLTDQTINYIKNQQFIFNIYKTAKSTGQQQILIPDDLYKILQQWIKINPTEYLLFDNNKNPLREIQLNQRLNKILGSGQSVNSLRHTFLTDNYKSTLQKYKQMETSMVKMGSSIAQKYYYVKP